MKKKTKRQQQKKWMKIFRAGPRAVKFQEKVQREKGKILLGKKQHLFCTITANRTYLL